MSTGIKASFAAALLLLAMVGGLYFSGYLVLLFLGLHQITQTWHSYWDYWQALDLPQVMPYATKIKVAGYLGIGLPLATWLLLLVLMFKPKEASLHGDASFAEDIDLKKANLRKKTPESILVGTYKGRYVYINGALHVIMIAATRTGKSTCIAVPVALTYEQSMVCLDLKGELLKLTSGQRAAMGQEIFVWAPYDEQGRTHRFNPLALMSEDQRLRISEIQTTSAILYPDEPGRDPFWTSQSRAAFVAFTSFMFERWDNMRKRDPKLHPNVSPLFPSFERILRLSSGGGDGEGVKAMLQGLLNNSSFMSQQTRTAFASLVGLAEQTFSSVIATMQAPLQQFLSPILAAATNGLDFDVRALRKRPMSIYCVIPPSKLGESSKLLNIFFSTVIGQNLAVHPDQDSSLKHQVLFLMDEFTAMGAVDVIADRISIAAGYGVRLLTIVQSNAQLRSTYGPDKARNYSTNHAAQIVFTPREQEDANSYSEMLGYRTVRKKNRSVSRGHGGSNVSFNVTEERRALMLPQEIKELPMDEELLLVEGCKPIRCRKNWYFKSTFFKKRILPPVEIKPIARQAVQSKEPKVVMMGGEEAIERLTA